MRENHPPKNQANAAHSPMVPVAFEIKKIHWENQQTFTWVLAAKDGQPLLYAPGQFNMLYIFGTGEVPISISGNPTPGRPLEHTIRVAGTVTQAMKELHVGQWVGLRGPFGTTWPVERAEGRDLILLAGGIGLAPLRPVLYAILEKRQRYGQVSLLVGARQPQDLLFQEELKAWAARTDLHVDVTVDIGSQGWGGHVGLVTERISHAPFEPHDTDAMICGPEIMMWFAARELVQAGVTPSRIALSMERNMKCAVGWCGHCQLGPHFICKDGPVYDFPTMRPWLQRREA